MTLAKKMIRESILEELRRRFPPQAYRVGTDGKTVAIFPSKCSEVGDVTIWDDGHEATVVIEHITHGHFNPYDESLSESERDICIWACPGLVDTPGMSAGLMFSSFRSQSPSGCDS